ncbi:MAG: DUF998 domain-containing protein [Sulfolobales archaeon]
MRLSKCFILAVSGYAIPLAFIAVAAASAGWFDVVRNALSDLGHATRSSVAPLFNLGLYLGAFILAIFASRYSLKYSRAITYLLLLTALTLGLVAVFDEVYGVLHFWVSVAFFLSISALLVAYSLKFRSYLLPLVALTTGVLSWVAHLAYRIPRGAAIPELVSIFVALPFYLRYSSLVCRSSSDG